MLILKAANLEHDGFAHGFFGRTGGVSRTIYESLNCGPGSNDAPEDVAENRKRALSALAGSVAARLVTCHQIHSSRAVRVTEPWEPPAKPHADAMVTDRHGIAIGVLTADCAPVLLADRTAHVIGAAHAGWKGAMDGVIESVVNAMTELGAERERIVAGIGPCISQEAYEVGPEFEERFREYDGSWTQFFAPAHRPEHWQFALTEFVRTRLETAGIAGVVALEACTYQRQTEFFSYRRATHRGEPDYGRQLSAIMLTV